MKQPTAIIDGKEYKIHSINWFENGKVCHISIHLNGDTECFFSPNAYEEKWKMLDDNGNYSYHDITFNLREELS